MSNSIVDAAQEIISQPHQVVKAAKIVAASTDSVDLAVKASKSALRAIEQALVEATAVRARTKLLNDLHFALDRIDAIFSRDFHEDGQQDTVQGRTYAGSLLVQRLNEARKILLEVIDSDDV